ncbi:MAG: hypothetical protein Q7K26_06210 [bacterium]|nr:hypothetical protein [bacterium]
MSQAIDTSATQLFTIEQLKTASWTWSRHDIYLDDDDEYPIDDDGESAFRFAIGKASVFALIDGFRAEISYYFNLHVGNYFETNDDIDGESVDLSAEQTTPIEKNFKLISIDSSGEIKESEFCDLRMFVDNLTIDLRNMDRNTTEEYLTSTNDEVQDDLEDRERLFSELIEAYTSTGCSSLRTSFYNADLVQNCRNLGGRWDTEEKAWMFWGTVADKIKVQRLDEKYNSAMVLIEVKALEQIDAWCAPVFLAGFKFCTATSCGSGAKLAARINFISGEITSSGSPKGWYTTIRKESVFRLEVPQNCIEDFGSNVFVTLL